MIVCPTLLPEDMIEMALEKIKEKNLSILSYLQAFIPIYVQTFLTMYTLLTSCTRESRANFLKFPLTTVQMKINKHFTLDSLKPFENK